MTGIRRGVRRAAVPLGFLLAAGFLLLAQDSEDWSASPEAYFLTGEERAEWKRLDSRDSRRDFIERYWLKRDPTQGTAKNEFRETILSRIKVSDSRFAIGKTPGSRTARGEVFIVLGTPARVQDENAPRPPPDPSGGRRLGQGVTPVALVEGNETTSTWLYEPDRTPRILEVIRRSSLQIKIVVEPSRHMDSIQDPGLFHEIKEIIARASIVNPDLVPAGAGGQSGREVPRPLPRQPLAAAVRHVLEAAPAASRSDGAFVGSAVVFRDGDPETLFWVFSPHLSKKPVLHALVRDGEGREVAALTEPGTISNAFSTLVPGMVVLRRLILPPGSYSASLALTDETEKPLAAASLPVQVPALEKEFGVSSLIITRGPAQGNPGANPVFTFGNTALPPRADAAFSPSESLWYFVEVANPTDSSRVMLEPRLRRNGEPLAGLAPFPALLQQIGSKRYLAGVELPLSTLAPGEYVLYLTVADGEGENRQHVLRRADFRVVR
jgi:GWxTD domain-containing protein